jgi:hypothetical protein
MTHVPPISFVPSPPPQQKSGKTTIQKLEELADFNVGLELNDDGDVFDVDTLELIRPGPDLIDRIADKHLEASLVTNKEIVSMEEHMDGPPPLETVSQVEPQKKLGLNVIRTAIPTLQQRKKFALAPGHGPLDWERLKRSKDMRLGLSSPIKIPKSEVAKHSSKDDCWMILTGKVYNLTPYMDFHPGGVDELMRAAGKDGTVLFHKTHSWVNTDYLLDACFLGFVI